MASKTEHELIVVPLDGSEQAEQVIPYAEGLRGRGGTLLFFQVVNPIWSRHAGFLAISKSRSKTSSSRSAKHREHG